MARAARLTAEKSSVFFRRALRAWTKSWLHKESSKSGPVLAGMLQQSTFSEIQKQQSVSFHTCSEQGFPALRKAPDLNDLNTKAILLRTPWLRFQQTTRGQCLTPKECMLVEQFQRKIWGHTLCGWGFPWSSVYFIYVSSTCGSAVYECVCWRQRTKIEKRNRTGKSRSDLSVWCR